MNFKSGDLVKFRPDAMFNWYSLKLQSRLSHTSDRVYTCGNIVVDWISINELGDSFYKGLFELVVGKDKITRLERIIYGI